MMLSAILTALIGFVSAIVGTAVSHRYIQARTNREFAERYRNRLFDKQLAAYEALWKCLAPTSTDRSDQTIFCGDASGTKFNRVAAERFCNELTRNFFLEHGLYLSKSTRRALFSTRNLLRKSLANSDAEGDLAHLEKDEYKELAAAIHELVRVVRTDIGLRALSFRPEDIGVSEDIFES